MTQRLHSSADCSKAIVRQGWCFPRSVRRFGERLLGQQLWCWGRDIVHPEGNLLRSRGFARCRPKTSTARASTCYRLDDDTRHIALWGFGMFYGRRGLGGLYLNRFEFCPRWASVESLSLGIHKAGDLPPFARPHTREQWEQAHRLCRELFGWIASYEHWILKSVGQDYRQECVDKWLHPFVPAKEMPKAWSLLHARGWELQRPAWNRTLQKIL